MESQLKDKLAAALDAVEAARQAELERKAAARQLVSEAFKRVALTTLECRLGDVAGSVNHYGFAKPVRCTPSGEPDDLALVLSGNVTTVLLDHFAFDYPRLRVKWVKCELTDGFVIITLCNVMPTK